jgi:hypothetical protein
VNQWPRQPVIYEINTWVWVQELSRHHRRRLTLGTIPQEEWDSLAGLEIDAVWLMGVWKRSPTGIRIARERPELLSAYREVLPDYSECDVVGSPYSVQRYTVDEHLGGTEGLAHARSQLARNRIRLILDYVPNHVARDHPWVMEHPEYFIQGDAEDLRREPKGFFRAGEKVIACGRDPYFPPWTDTSQLNVFSPGLREAAIETLYRISEQCDGVRCDMAMLLIGEVFEKTWGMRTGPRPASEFWRELIEDVRRRCPGFLFLGEAYWDLEWELQQQGFDYCYDKRLYDRLVHGSAEGVLLHLGADVSYQERLARFIENHDELRAGRVFPPDRLRVAALAAHTLPGAKLFHEGQFEGRRVRVPVQLGRRPEEDVNQDLVGFYRRLRELIRRIQSRGSEWRLCGRNGWPDNSSHLNLAAWCWRGVQENHLVVVNLSGDRAQARVRWPFPDLSGRSVLISDLFSGAVYRREGDEMIDPGLYVDIEAWGFHFLSVDRLES